MSVTDIPIIPRQVNTLHNSKMARYSRPTISLLSPNFPRARMVHWLARTSPLAASPTNDPQVAYSLGIYLLNLFLAFLSPKFDPSMEEENMENGGDLPTKQDQEFRPFVRRLPEFKFWYSATRACTIAFVCSWFSVFDVPVFWPVLVMYWLILFVLTSTSGPWSSVEERSLTNVPQCDDRFSI